ncbi:MAG: type II toxin-antitoxin system RelE family toxin [Verrucomicrobiota bacterium]
MGCYNIEWRPSTKKDLKRISKTEVQRIIKAVESLSGQPRPPGSTKLSGSDLTYRIRVGNYRVIYEIHDEIILIEVVKVGHRKDVYRQ